MITEFEMGKEESELELGLGLSLGGGTSKIGKSGGGGGAWGECGRLLTAKDFPSVGSKRAADSGDASPPCSRSQVVGWPPIGSHRMNTLVNNQATKSAKVEEEEAGKKIPKDVELKDTTKKVQIGFIKVNMDGVAIGRKVDLNAYSSYENLAQTLEDMFFRVNPQGTAGLMGKFTRLLDGSSEFVLTYEDKEGDWMLVGDVPWRMFINSAKRLRVMKTSEANGIATTRHQE